MWHTNTETRTLENAKARLFAKAETKKTIIAVATAINQRKENNETRRSGEKNISSYR